MEPIRFEFNKERATFEEPVSRPVSPAFIYYSVFISVDPKKRCPQYTIVIGPQAAILPVTINVDQLLTHAENVEKRLCCAEIRIDHHGKDMTPLTTLQAHKLHHLIKQNPEPVAFLNQVQLLPDNRELHHLLSSIRFVCKVNMKFIIRSDIWEDLFNELIKKGGVQELTIFVHQMTDAKLFTANIVSLMKETKFRSISVKIIPEERQNIVLQWDILNHILDSWRDDIFPIRVKRSNVAELYYAGKFKDHLEQQFGALLDGNEYTVYHDKNPNYTLKLIKVRGHFCDYMFRIVF
ncbi:hypothetical protein QR680_019359 [Steinernema hermaphroditum]|uniref:Uncharacterized protein n=1 Tax=Steinernema hermaphroditum TaxID=289476 RepID=A0AA39GNZ0_9BILA|nr:hypothetical protein QR680_019359 [Steinernema hermaphroditum]